MNNKVGLKDIFEHKEALTLMARSLSVNQPNVMLEAVKLMAAFCLVPPDGHEKTLEAITIAGEMKGGDRFTPIVQGLMLRNNEQLRTNCLILINAIITSTDDLDFRMHLRNEFMRVGLMDVLDVRKNALVLEVEITHFPIFQNLDSNSSEELRVQLKVFYEHRDEDFDEFGQRFDNIRLELDDINECFELIKNMVMDTPAEPYLLSMFQHFLCIRDDVQIRPAYYKLIEECVSQIVLHKSGCDPDFRATRFHIDVEPLIEQLVEKSSREDEGMNKGMKGELEEALTMKQETEAKLFQAQAQIAQLEEALRSGGGSPSKLPTVPGLVVRPPAPPPGSGPKPPPPPPGGGPPPPPPPPGGGPAPPPPPPPPGGGPPPPPPPPGGGPPPPPPPLGGLRPPGASPASPAVNQEDILVKLGMKRKKKWQVEAQTKRTNWKSVRNYFLRNQTIRSLDNFIDTKS